jgi:hypothetical protein
MESSMPWIEITRRQHDRKGLRYASDTTDAEWRWIAAQPLDIPRKSRFIVVCCSETHINLHRLMSQSLPLPESGPASRATF